MDLQRTKQQVKDPPNLPPGAVGETFKVEEYKDGYKITQTVGKPPHSITSIIFVDFKTGVTAVRDAQGEELDRIKVVRVSSTEIQETSLSTGATFNYRVIEGGNYIEVKISDRKDAKPSLVGYYKHSS